MHIFTRLKRLLGYGAVAVVLTTTMTPSVLDHVKDFEGTVLTTYIDMVGEPTIGTGHTNQMGTHRFNMGDTWTAEYANEVLLDDLQYFWDTIDEQITVDLTQCQQSILTSWAYNVGTGATGKSTLVRRLNQGKYGDVPAQLMRWNKGKVNGKMVTIKGLTRRRAAEVELWKTGCKS